MCVEMNGKFPYKSVIDKVIVTGEEISKEWRGALRRITVPGTRNAYIGITSLHRGALKGYALLTFLIKLEDLTDKEQGDLAKQASEKAWGRMIRARKNDFS